MRFKLCILIVISVFLFASLAPAAEFGKSKNARIVIDTQKGALNIWTFYDTGLQMLCYVTKNGASISCTPYHQLSAGVQAKITEHIAKRSKDAPPIIHIP